MNKRNLCLAQRKPNGAANKQHTSLPCNSVTMTAVSDSAQTAVDGGAVAVAIIAAVGIGGGACFAWAGYKLGEQHGWW